MQLPHLSGSGSNLAIALLSLFAPKGHICQQDPSEASNQPFAPGSWTASTKQLTHENKPFPPFRLSTGVTERKEQSYGEPSVPPIPAATASHLQAAADGATAVCASSAPCHLVRVQH